MELKVTESPSFADGEYKGVIVRVEYRDEPYKYTDFYILESKTQIELKYGCPTNSSIESKLMSLLGKFIDIKPGMNIDPAAITVGKAVKFMLLMEKKGDKEFARIVDGSLKPMPKGEMVTPLIQSELVA